MEERKKLGPVGVIGLTLLLLVLAVACYLSAGLPDLSMGLGPWGVYSTDAQSTYLVTAYEMTDTGDVLITDRRKAPRDGELVTYLMDGRRIVDLYDDVLGRPVLAMDDAAAAASAQPVVFIVHDGGMVLHLLHGFRYAVWGAAAGLALILLVLKLTANTRWKKRQQKLMRKNFEKFGEKYAREDEELDY